MGLDKETAEERRNEEIKQIQNFSVARVGSRRGWRDGYDEHECDISII